MLFTLEEARLVIRANDIVGQMVSVDTEEGRYVDWPQQYENLFQPTKALLDNGKRDLADLGLFFFYYGFWPRTFQLIRSENKEVDPFMEARGLLETENALRNISRFVVSEIGPIETQALISGNFRMQDRLAAALDEETARSERVNSQHDKLVNPASDVTTLILHGTWARNEIWWQINGRFWNYIDNQVSNLYGGADAFSWSGKNDHGERKKGAQELVDWVAARNIKELDIIAHSHGGNVALQATKLGLKIRKLITLGTPIRTEYIPHLPNLDHMINVFSTGDIFQKPAGTFPNIRSEGRTLADTEKITNVFAEDDGRGGRPGHSELHDTSTWRASRLFEYL